MCSGGSPSDSSRAVCVPRYSGGSSSGPAGRKRPFTPGEAGTLDSLTKRWPAGCAFFAWITGKITQLLTGSTASRVRFDSVMEEFDGFMLARALPAELRHKVHDYYKSK